ncbi:hypothetical protein H5410_053023, partial [Solanum commersonii]
EKIIVTCTKCKLTIKHVTTGTQGGTGRLRTHLRKCNKEFVRLDDIERANRSGIHIPENYMGVEEIKDNETPSVEDCKSSIYIYKLESYIIHINLWGKNISIVEPPSCRPR